MLVLRILGYVVGLRLVGLALALVTLAILLVVASYWVVRTETRKTMLILALILTVLGVAISVGMAIPEISGVIEDFGTTSSER